MASSPITINVLHPSGVFSKPTHTLASLTVSSFQFLTISFLNPSNASSCLLTGVYASTNYVQRRDLWDYLSSQANTNLPWCVLGDFNSITSSSEKMILRPSRLIPDFQNLILSSGLQDMGFTGSIFTWSNNSRASSYVAARLDRALCNHL